MFLIVESQRQGLVDLLAVGDSTTTSVNNPGVASEGQRFSMGDLLKGMEVPGIAEASGRDCLRQFHQCMVGWSGNDVHGEFIKVVHGSTKRCLTKSEADWKVAAEWPVKQKARVDNSHR